MWCRSHKSREGNELRVVEPTLRYQLSLTEELRPDHTRLHGHSRSTGRAADLGHMTAESQAHRSVPKLTVHRPWTRKRMAALYRHGLQIRIASCTVADGSVGHGVAFVTAAAQPAALLADDNQCGSYRMRAV